MRLRSTLTVGTLVGAASLLAAGQPGAAEPKNAPAKVERIEGTPYSRVILTEQAAARIGVVTTEVREMALARKRLVAGLATEAVAMATNVASAQTIALAPALLDQVVQWVEVRPVGELDKVAGARPARVLPLTGADQMGGWRAEPVSHAALDTGEASDAPLLFELRGGASGMPALGPVLVELALSDDAALHKVAPFDAVLYGAEGGTWVYTSPEPLVFVRHAVKVEYIDQGLAVLSEGPPAGTRIVSVGVAELFGTEFKIGK